MKLTINGDEIEIKVKGKYNSRANKESTMYFLNTICIWAGEAARIYKIDDCGALEKEARNAQKDIHAALAAAGLYDGI